MHRYLFLLLFLFGCETESIPNGRILVRNDIGDKNYNSFVIDQVVTKAGLAGFRKVLEPGERILLPQKGIRKLRFTRKYEDHSKVYVVKCPDKLASGIVMKLIDVHTNRIKGDCKLVKKGKKVSGVTHWEN